MKRITVLISGSGSNLQALIDASQSPRLPGQITFVLSSRSNAYGLTRASNAGIPTSICALKTYLTKNPGSTRVEYDAEVAKRVMESRPDLVVLAGWMHILSPAFLDAIHVPIINLHPALPGAFDGANAIGRAYEAFGKGEVKGTGAMVHRVVKEVDRGEPLVVREVEIKKGETLEELETRIHEVEHEIIVEGARIALDA
ncbi:phosphoribosylglycinamide formyltransferase [Dioszegia hungarica]|uniref:Phosphoribosylglycinamide formyltransferase n=1 Tax=Dioszegia hungarica TaxID=4972 RepID=A0AA38HAD9_9TREE|nr:phosphoribosylglycinamide formyltransferase [Dioszegia hungarica]KAI9637120.1 phosphoribosylglycinamide formyltransferase [Dioszegia hungarica]